MYAGLRTAPEGSTTSAALPLSGRVGSTVLALGTVSLLTDISSEMVAAVLPVYLTLALGLSPVAYGLVDGLYQGATVLVRLVGGFTADARQRPKAVAQFGYGLSAVSKLGLIAAGPQAAALSLIVTVDRAGKGLRTAPRDAMIAGSVDPAGLGRAFGVHRAMDTVGAMGGPLLAAGLLLALPGDYNSLFLTSFGFALLGCLVLWAFVREPAQLPDTRPVRPVQVRALLREPSLRRLLGVCAVLGLLTVSDGFLYLNVRDLVGISATWFPLLFLGTAAVYLALAVPMGRLADRYGRVRVFLGGHVVLLGVYGCLLVGSDLPVAGLLVGVVGLLGVYYAATDGVLPAVAASLVPTPLRATGIALAQTSLATGRLLSAVAFGLLWTVSDQSVALSVFGAGLVTAMPVALRVLHRLDVGAPRA